MSAATLDAPPATASPETQVDPQRERLAFERAAAIKRGENAARRLRAEADALKIKLADATRARDEALAAVRLAEARVQDAALMHTRTVESAELQLRRTAPREIAACRAELEQIRFALTQRAGRTPEEYAAAERQTKAIAKANNRLDELELTALSPTDLAANLQRIREDVERAGEVTPLPRPRRVPAGLQAAWDRLRQIEEDELGRLDPTAAAAKCEAVRAAREKLGELWRDGAAGGELESAVAALMEGVEAVGRPGPAVLAEKRRRRTYES